MTREQYEDRMFYLLMKMSECQRIIRQAEKAREELEQYRVELEQLAREYAEDSTLATKLKAVR
ncbi:hypothetical protein [Desulfovirgula thermocuniculi]|uniref:hypothetical protein n=1 Tax=Desulfovirgula thermocuniculi TaxID=348842 RepID=UPI0003FD2CDB|nr:hypothetical protein [Desulfovirgula thermocuniculi]